MEHIYQYALIISLILLIVPFLIRAGLLLFMKATKSLRRMLSFIYSFFIVFSIKLSIQEINRSSIYQTLWSLCCC
uniref:NADH-plastoquinone oxidoreductase subunit 5 n=1 Tax=Drosophyllum lusitanicum TaxID=4373 RepID=A0A411K6M0_DROLU|nr:NADH-plastoquinone oxidoreductase subunit 5 [Drosophyllum lusitanicum]QBC72970.1 NADH-plastoquinone oxidoreductase subunit 5 [Drosophyllum lusitanicum]